MIEQRFANPVIKKTANRQGLIGRVQTKRQLDGRASYRYLHQDGRVVLQFEACAPSTTIRAM
jgi:hypothetical protein